MRSRMRTISSTSRRRNRKSAGHLVITMKTCSRRHTNITSRKRPRDERGDARPLEKVPRRPGVRHRRYGGCPAHRQCFPDGGSHRGRPWMGSCLGGTLLASDL